MNDKAFSQTCSFLRLPLMVLVVLIHVRYDVLITLPKSSFSYSVVFFFSQVISRVAVPSFFLISGYYFFFDVGKKHDFSLQDYKTKLLKRIYSLLIPYLIWNILYCIIKSMVLNKNVFQLLLHIFDFPMPVAIQFWYIRDLMILCLISPIVYILIKRLGLFFIQFLLIIWVINFEIVLDTSLTFFSIGAYFSINRKDIVLLLKKVRPYIYMVALFFCVSDMIFNLVPTNTIHVAENVYPIHRLFILSGIIALFCWASSVVGKKDKTISKYNASSFVFLLFALHPLATPYIFTPLLVKILGKENTPLLLAYFLPIILSILVTYLLYLLMNKYFKGLLSILVGKRT